jgi:SAM-dependent methyltransferase
MATSREETGPFVAPAGNASGALRYDRPVDLSDANTAHAKLVAACGEHMRVLEVGPSTGYLSEVLRARGCAVTGLEIDPAAAAVAQEHCDRIVVGDVERIDLHGCFSPGEFDVVMFGDVLEHLVDPAAVLGRVAPLLAPDGRVVASIPNVAYVSVRLALLAGRFRYTDQGLLDRTHLRFFDRGGIQALFAGAGYDVLSWDRVVVRPEKAEVLVPWDAIPPILVETVMNAPEATTYQFVVEARPASANTRQRSVEDVDATFEPIRALQRHALESDRQKDEALAEAARERRVTAEARADTAQAHRELRSVLDARSVRAAMLAGRVYARLRGRRGSAHVEGAVEDVAAAGDGRVRVTGWCWSTALRRPRVAVFVGGERAAVTRADVDRPDLGWLGVRRPAVGFVFDQVKAVPGSEITVAAISPRYLVLGSRAIPAPES